MARILGVFIFYFLYIAIFPFVNKERGTLSAKLGASLLPQIALSLSLGVFIGSEVYIYIYIYRISKLVYNFQTRTV